MTNITNGQHIVANTAQTRPTTTAGIQRFGLAARRDARRNRRAVRAL